MAKTKDAIRKIIKELDNCNDDVIFNQKMEDLKKIRFTMAKDLPIYFLNSAEEIKKPISNNVSPSLKREYVLWLFELIKRINSAKDNTTKVDPTRYGKIILDQLSAGDTDKKVFEVLDYLLQLAPIPNPFQPENKFFDDELIKFLIWITKQATPSYYLLLSAIKISRRLAKDFSAEISKLDQKISQEIPGQNFSTTFDKLQTDLLQHAASLELDDFQLLIEYWKEKKQACPPLEQAVLTRISSVRKISKEQAEVCWKMADYLHAISAPANINNFLKLALRADYPLDGKILEVLNTRQDLDVEVKTKIEAAYEAANGFENSQQFLKELRGLDAERQKDKNHTYLQLIQKLKTAALKGFDPAIQQLEEISKKNVILLGSADSSSRDPVEDDPMEVDPTPAMSEPCYPEAEYALFEIYQAKITEDDKSYEEKIKHYEKLARKGFQKLLSQKNTPDLRPEVYSTLADLFYQGKIFERNVFLAYELYEKAYQLADPESVYPLAKMSLEGVGCDCDFAKAQQYASEMTNKSTDALLLRARLSYINFLAFSDDKKLDDANEMRQLTVSDYVTAWEKAEAAESEADEIKHAIIYELYGLWFYEKAIEAVKALADIYLKGGGDSLPDLAFDDVDRKDYALFFYNNFLKAGGELEDPDLRSRVEVYAQQIEQKRATINNQARIYFDTVNGTNQPDAIRIETLKQLSKTPWAKFILAWQAMTKENTLPLRQAYYLNDFSLDSDGAEYSLLFDKAKSLLITYYRDKIPQLLTIYCYEAFHHAATDPALRLIKEVLFSIKPEFEKKAIDELREHLEGIENNQAAYFDEDISDDPDSENEKTYQKSDHRRTAARNQEEGIFENIEKKLTSLLKKIDGKETPLTEKEYKDLNADIMNAFSNIQVEKFKHHLHGKLSPADLERACRDLETLNHYSANGELVEGLKRIATSFVVAETRGVYYDTRHWSQPERRRMREMLLNEKHPFLKVPIYSFSVYERAGVNDFTDLNPSTLYRLKMISLYTRARLQKLLFQEMDKTSDTIPEAYRNYMFENYTHQLQQFYSHNHTKFHEFLQQEITTEDHAFVNARNPFVSMGDAESSHGPRYAHGAKIYQENQAYRLRPKHNSQGRALRPHSGYTTLILLPIENLARKDAMHIPSLNMLGKLNFDPRLVSEREYTVFSVAESKIDLFILPARFPSFHHEKYLKIFAHDHGLQQNHYVVLKKLFSETSPHELKRRLLVDLLGIYLSVYTQIYLLRYAYEHTTDRKRSKDGDELESSNEKRQVLIFRDPYGNFSFKPTLNNNFLLPKPHGDTQTELLQRQGTERQALIRKRRAEEAPEKLHAGRRQEIAHLVHRHSSSIFADSRQEVRKLTSKAQELGLSFCDVNGKGDSFFHAVADQLQIRQFDQQLDHSALRKRACDYMEQDKEGFSSFKSTAELASYIQKMRQEGTCVECQMIILALAKALDIKIHIVDAQGQDWSCPRDDLPKLEIYLGYLQARNHYVSLRPTTPQLALDAAPL